MRGETTFKAGTVPDFALTRGNGIPLYTLVNPVDDALMKITHVLRGEDLLSSTPRQLALYEAMQRIGVAEFTPKFGHLPFVMGQGNKKLSKRDPESNLFIHRDRGFVPEGLLNYLALLGWGISDDHDVFSLDEMVAAFDISTVNSNPARFDQKKADAINAEHIRLLEPADFAARLRAFLTLHGHLGETVDESVFATAAELVQTRIVVLSDAWDLLKFLFVDEADFAIDPAAAAKNLAPTPYPYWTPPSRRWTQSRRGMRPHWKRPSRPLSWTNWASSHVRRSLRCGWPSRARTSARRSMNRWNCSDATFRCPGCALRGPASLARTPLSGRKGCKNSL